MNKQYKTISGKPVRIICTDSAIPDYPVVAIVNNDYVTTYTEDGKYYKYESATNNIMSLVEISPYEDWEIDDPISIIYQNGEKLSAHFAGVDEITGHPKAFLSGKTSHTGSATTALYTEICTIVNLNHS